MVSIYVKTFYHENDKEAYTVSEWFRLCKTTSKAGQVTANYFWSDSALFRKCEMVLNQFLGKECRSIILVSFIPRRKAMIIGIFLSPHFQ